MLKKRENNNKNDKTEREKKQWNIIKIEKTNKNLWKIEKQQWTIIKKRENSEKQWK